MTTVIESAFAGDSHGMIMADAGEKAGISFRKTITAAAANFMGASLIGQDDGRIEFQMDDFRKDAEFFGQEKTERFARKAARLGVLFDQAVQQKLPFFSNIGMTAIHFVRDMTAAAQANGEDAALMSAKMARFAAQGYFDRYMEFYRELARLAPRVTCIFGPTRFLPETRHLWMAYDDVAQARLADLGIGVLDLRARFGGADLLLEPRYRKDSDDDLVHANELWGRETMQILAEHRAEDMAQGG